MQQLLDALIAQGANPNRMIFKLFGGGNLICSGGRVGACNAEFVRQFMQYFGYRITCEDMEGEHPRMVHFYPFNGRVMLKRLVAQWVD